MVDHLEIETAKWVEWWNTRWLRRACGDIAPAECEANNGRNGDAAAPAAYTRRKGLYGGQGNSMKTLQFATEIRTGALQVPWPTTV